MAKKIDLATVSPERAARLLAGRAEKKREYQRRKEVFLARGKTWQAANPEKFKAAVANWKAENPERVADAKRAWYEANRASQLARAAARNIELADSVVKSQYVRGTPLQSKDVPDDLAPLIRTTILVKRAIKEQKRELRRSDQ